MATAVPIMTPNEARQRIDPERLRALFDYDPQTGLLTWRPGRKGCGGRKAGTLYASGYLKVNIGETRASVQQIAWAIVNGTFAENVQQVNGNRQDNRLANLRACDAQNRAWGARPSNRPGKTSRFKGVYWNVQHEKWRAVISPNGRRISLGSYTDEVDAAKAYDRALREIAGPFARTNFPET